MPSAPVNYGKVSTDQPLAHSDQKEAISPGDVLFLILDSPMGKCPKNASFSKPRELFLHSQLSGNCYYRKCPSYCHFLVSYPIIVTVARNGHDLVHEKSMNKRTRARFGEQKKKCELEHDVVQKKNRRKTVI